MKSPESKVIKKVLIVDDEKLFLASLKEGLAVLADEFSVLTAANGAEALDELGRQEIDLVVTDLKMPVMDGFQLLGQMMTGHPRIPVIVMTAFGTPDIEKQIQHLDAYDYLEKPVDFQILADKIRAGINKTSDGHLKGIMLFSFLQLLQMDQKTCLLKIASHGRRGDLYFSRGELIDAVHKNLDGEEAALEIVGWEDAEIELVGMTKKMRRRIEIPLQNLLMESARLKDEAALNHPPAPDLPDAEEVDKFLGNFDDLLDPEPLLQILDRQNNLLKEKTSAPATNPENIAPGTPAGERFSDSINSTNSSINLPNNKEQNKQMANNINESLEQLMTIDGAMAVALVDTGSGMALGAMGSGVNLDVAAAGNTEVIKSKQKVMANLGLKDKIEDILITLGQQYHLMRPLTNHQNLFFYLVMNRTNSNLAMARFKLSDIEGKVEV